MAQNIFDSEGKYNIRRNHRDETTEMTPPHADQWIADILNRMEIVIDRTALQVAHIDREGCAQREGDLKHLALLNSKVDDIKLEFRGDINEIKKLLTRIFIGVMAILVSGLGYLVEQTLMHRK